MVPTLRASQRPGDPWDLLGDPPPLLHEVRQQLALLPPSRGLRCATWGSRKFHALWLSFRVLVLLAGVRPRKDSIVT